MARFTAETKVAEALAADPGLVERLCAYHPAFTKLRNPILRRVMARLINFGEASKVAGVPLDELLAVVNGEARCASHEPGPPAAPEPEPAWMANHGAAINAATLDVRPLIAAGEEPLGPVLRLAATIAAGGWLVLDAPFDPAPLRRVLGAKGFSDYGRWLEDGHWRIWFYRDGGGRDRKKRVDEAAIWREEDTIHIDVRGLEAPKPMHAILQLLEQPDTGDLVILHHEREPVFLFPELLERGWNYENLAGEPGEVRLKLFRARR